MLLLSLRFARFNSFQGLFSNTRAFNDNNFFVPSLNLRSFVFLFIRGLWLSVKESGVQTLEK